MYFYIIILITVAVSTNTLTVQGSGHLQEGIRYGTNEDPIIDTVTVILDDSTARTYETRNGEKYKILYFTDSLGNRHFAGSYEDGWGSKIDYYSKGELRSIQFYKNGVLNGIARFYHRNGNLKRIGVLYDPNIVISRDTVIVNGEQRILEQISSWEYHGIWQNFNENGKLYMEELYDSKGVLKDRRMYQIE